MLLSYVASGDMPRSRCSSSFPSSDGRALPLLPYCCSWWMALGCGGSGDSDLNKLGSGEKISDLVIPHPAAFLFMKSTCCCRRILPVEGERVQSRGEICAGSTAFTLPAEVLAKLPCFQICCVVAAIREPMKAEFAGVAGLARQDAIRLKATLQSAPVVVSSDAMPSSSSINHGGAAQMHGADVQNLRVERLVAVEFNPAHEEGMQYFCCPWLSFFRSDCRCNLCTSAAMPIYCRSLDAARGYTMKLAGEDGRLLIRYHFVSSLVLLQIYSGWRPHALGQLSSMLSIILPGRRTPHPLQADVHADYAIFLPPGLIRRRRMRASPLSLLRFSGEDPYILSSVLRHLDLQLNQQPQMHLPTRLPVESLALRLARL